METEAGPGRPRGVAMETSPGQGSAAPALRRLRTRGSCCARPEPWWRRHAGTCGSTLAHRDRRYRYRESAEGWLGPTLNKVGRLCPGCARHPPSCASLPSASSIPSVHFLRSARPVNLNHQPLSHLLCHAFPYPPKLHLTTPSSPHAPRQVPQSPEAGGGGRVGAGTAWVGMPGYALPQCLGPEVLKVLTIPCRVHVPTLVSSLGLPNRHSVLSECCRQIQISQC